MHVLKSILVIGVLGAGAAMPAVAQERSAARPTQVEVTDPSGTFVDEYGTSFTCALCGES